MTVDFNLYFYLLIREFQHLLNADIKAVSQQ